METIVASPIVCTELYKRVTSALETYSNVHRGTGIKSLVSTHLYEKARTIVCEYLKLNANRYKVVFCTYRRAYQYKQQLDARDYVEISSNEINLPLGVHALAIKNKVLKKLSFEGGGGTACMVAKDWVEWAKAPDKFEAGTPAVMNVIVFAVSLHLLQTSSTALIESNEVNSVYNLLYEDSLSELFGKELFMQLISTQVGKELMVPTVYGNRKFINFDSSASTSTFQPIYNAFLHGLALKRDSHQELIDEVKNICANFLNASKQGYDITFTSNTTESVNILTKALSFDSNVGNSIVLNTIAEHSSNDIPWRLMPGGEVVRLTLTEEGFIDEKLLKDILESYNEKNEHGSKRIKLISVFGASNVLGSCSNLKAIGTLAHKYGALFFVDAAQLVAHRKIDMEADGIDFLAFSAHKIYAPFGTGVLVYKKGLVNFNDVDKKIIETSGNQNIGGIAALGKAIHILQRIGMDVIAFEEHKLTKYAIHELAKVKGFTLYGVKDSESPAVKDKLGVFVLHSKDMMADKVAQLISQRGGIGVRAGCHCSHLIVKQLLNIGPRLEKFQRLVARNFPGTKFPGVTRVSLGIENTKDDIDALLQIFKTWNSKVPSTDIPIRNQVKDFVSEREFMVYGR